MTSTIIEGLTCAWCDANGSQKKCYRCRDACRQPRLNDRLYSMQVTGNNGLLPFAVVQDASFTTVNGCCSSVTAFPRPAPNDRSETSGVYQWRRLSQTYTSVDWIWATCVNPSTGECRYIPPVERCRSTFQTALGCALGWRRIAGITSAKLYISRTQPRYGCDEPDECRYRIALVIEGEIGVTWGTQYTQGSQTTVISSNPFCDLPANCVSGTSGIWPVGSPPPFDPSRLSVTMHPFRLVLRRSIDTLEFPMVFNQDNAVGLSCGPQCAAAISAITPTFGDPPALTCGPLFDLGSTPPPDFDNDEVNLCTETTCDDTFCDHPNLITTSGSQENTLTGSTDSGVVTPGLLPDTAFPTEWTVELY
jgi:hypothetical protein